ncbi:HAD hydrolase family protein [Sphingomonas sp. CFBP 13706]|uniref:HAD hydrolase family protein n=1 Tax=Sphingomonas sp. CFBP 13706 TaxID=2775314 RepID=UPI0017835A31|nr:HAD hydrolase family protein [Sphingomonas sp. CFBP 13706]MBD8736227.1 HAD hydrolase family protein [Sphingomonas sp. CFBP 13706]
MTRFSEKLDALPRSVAMLADQDLGPLAAAIRGTRGRRTIVVASGGSVVAAHFLARCRETLFGECTVIATPMELVLGNGDLGLASVWILSAGADNPDTVAAVLAANARGAEKVVIVTRNSAGAALSALKANGSVHVVPVADHKDGFLATHSLVSTIGALLMASDLASIDPIGRSLADAWMGAVDRSLSPDARAAHLASFSDLSGADTILLAADPRAATLAVLIETSAWEASLCAVQRTDLRNLAHGRHAWLHHRPERVRLIALCGIETRNTWERIDALVPADVRRTVVDLGDCGRYRNAVGAISGLGMIEAIGASVGIDPGKPGIGEFGRTLYADTSLLELARTLAPCVRQKRDACAVRDDPAFTEADPVADAAAHRDALSAKPIGGVVLDYDGTIVSTDARYDPPMQVVIEQLVRIHSAGVSIAIATGRGGSAGEELRRALPREIHDSVIVGYYNGGHLAPLSVDLVDEPPVPNDAIVRVGGWLRTNARASVDGRMKVGAVQITITVARPAEADDLAALIAELPELQRGELRMARSGHSIDVIARSASKMAVVTALQARTPNDKQILTIGDSGARGGNDCEILSRSAGISVGEVCGRSEGSHSMFGREITGPEALVEVLRAIRPSLDGRMRLHVEDFCLDAADQ